MRGHVSFPGEFLQNKQLEAQDAIGNFASQHPDWTSVATRLQSDGQNLCRNVCARSIEAAKSLKQRLGEEVYLGEADWWYGEYDN